MADLFDFSMKLSLATETPLAARMRPRTLEEYVGQEHILSEGKILRGAIVECVESMQGLSSFH